MDPGFIRTRDFILNRDPIEHSEHLKQKTACFSMGDDLVKIMALTFIRLYR